MMDILRNQERAIFRLRELYRGFGYLPYRMSRFEEYDLYVRNKDFLVSQEIITFADRSGRLLALKPDVTLSIIKNAPSGAGVVQKLYYNENVYRVDKGTHTFREIMQAGLECVGDLGEYEIVETLLLAVKSLQLLGSWFVLNLSHMGLISAVLSGSGLSEDAAREAAEFLQQKSLHSLADLCERQGVPGEKLLLLAQLRGSAAEVIPPLAEILTTPEEKQALEQLRGICDTLADQGYGDAVQVDFSVGSDLKYYSGVVFRGYLEGIPQSVLSGGQYDRLLRRMGKKGSAIGFAVNVDLLQRQEKQSSEVDTLILHDPDVSPARILAAMEQAGKEGTVLVAQSVPADRSFKKLVELKGETE